jgi:hypothetical protein
VPDLKVMRDLSKYICVGRLCGISLCFISYHSVGPASTHFCQIISLFWINSTCWEFEYSKIFSIFAHIILFFGKKNYIFEDFNISANNIISVETAKVTWYEYEINKSCKSGMCKVMPKEQGVPEISGCPRQKGLSNLGMPSPSKSYQV